MISPENQHTKKKKKSHSRNSFLLMFENIKSIGGFSDFRCLLVVQYKNSLKN